MITLSEESTYGGRLTFCVGRYVGTIEFDSGEPVKVIQDRVTAEINRLAEIERERWTLERK